MTLHVKKGNWPQGFPGFGDPVLGNPGFGDPQNPGIRTAKIGRKRKIVGYR